MKKKFIYLLFALVVMTSCASFERTKTTKVDIEIGRSSTSYHKSPDAHQSKKSYSGMQHKTHLTEKMALTSDSSVKE